MKVLNVRHADLASEFYVTSEVEIVRSLNNLGHPTTLVGIGNRPRDFGTPVRLLKAPLDRSFVFRLKLLFLLPLWVIARRIDVVMLDVRSARTAILLLPLKWLGLCKLILDVRTIPVESNVTWRFTGGMQFAQRWFDGASMITHGTRDHIREKMGFDFAKSVIWTSGVNVDIFSPDSAPPPAGLVSRVTGRFVLFYHGSISPNRGVTDILDALNEVKSEMPDVLLISLSNNNAFVREYCRTQGYALDDHLLLLDAVANVEVPSYIRLADCCIVPLPRIDWWEVSSPLKLMEYLSMGKPTILTDIKAHLEVVPRGTPCALYYDPDKPGELAARMRDAHSDRSALQDSGPRGRDIVTADFTWDRQAQKLVEFLDTL